MFFEISRETTNSPRVLLTQHGLMNADNFAKVEALPTINQYPTFMEILVQCHTCKEGSYHLNQAAFDKLVETIKIIDIQNDDDDGLILLAASGLLNEETLELFATNPSAFSDESKFSDKGSDLKAIVQGIIDEQKQHLSEDIPLKSLPDQDAIARYLINRSNLTITSNLMKVSALSDHNERYMLIEALAQCHTCKKGSYHLNQATFDKLVETVKIIDMQHDDDEGLMILAASGLLNEETLELFATNPSAFSDESKFSDKGSDLKAIVQGIIDEQKSAFRPRS